MKKSAGTLIAHGAVKWGPNATGSTYAPHATPQTTERPATRNSSYIKPKN
jgi:hypothetical protein